MNLETSSNWPGSTSPLTAASRQRLQKVFEHAQRCVDKQDFDYANKLFTQCLVEDPGNLVYLQSFLANLHKKNGDRQKGSRLAGLKIKSKRSSLTKAAGKGEWEAAMTAGCAALALNPWDIATLLALAAAYGHLQSDECQLYCLRCALNADAKDVEVNRQAGLALQRMGQFDQAIACWQRVKLALPQDEQARQAIARLSVEQTIDKGGYDSSLLSNSSSYCNDQDSLPMPAMSVAQLSTNAEPVDGRPPEVRLLAAIADDPTAAEQYVQLAALFLRELRFDEAEQLLGQGLNACGSSDLQIRSQLEDVQLRRVSHQLALAEQCYQQDPNDEANELVHRFRIQANQVELEIYAARVERDSTNLRLKYELGLRLKRAGKIKEAISVLQAARTDSKRELVVLVELGECFQHIEQYKLALSHYEQAIEALRKLSEPESEIYRKALYRAGVLATGMQEMDRAEGHLTTLAALDFGYRDVADRLDKIARLRDSR